MRHYIEIKYKESVSCGACRTIRLRKTALSDSLCAMEHLKSETYCTKPGDKHRYLTEDEFNAQDFFEKTRYAGIQYGTKMEDIEAVLEKGHFVVMPLDMCGAIAMKRHFLLL